MTTLPALRALEERLDGPVPCNGCTLCCRGDAIMLFPDDGDDVASYETEVWTLPGTSERGHILKHGLDGNCIYLGKGGCTIYERRPLVCRAFDCRRWFLSKTRAERRRAVKEGWADKEIFDRGRALIAQEEAQI